MTWYSPTNHKISIRSFWVNVIKTCIRDITGDTRQVITHSLLFNQLLPLSTNSMNPNSDHNYVGEDRKEVWWQGRVVRPVTLDSARIARNKRTLQSADASVLSKIPYQDMSDENLGIRQYDLLFENVADGRAMRKRDRDEVMREAELARVVATFNGEDMSKINKDDHGDWVFAGVANQNMYYDSNMAFTATGVAAQCGGTISIYNNSDEPVLAGDLLYFELPFDKVEHDAHRTVVRGCKPGRATAVVRPYRKSLEMEKRALKGKVLSPDQLYKELDRLVNFSTNRIFAKAIESAKPGQIMGVQLMRPVWN